MANVLIGDIEIGLEKISHWLAKAQSVLIKGPHIITALGTLLVAVDKVIADAQLDLSNPVALISISLPAQQLADLKLVWADIKAVFAASGVVI